MERSLRKSSKAKQQRSNPTKSSEQAAHGGKDYASAAYDEYLWLLQQRNRLLKRLKTKDEQQVELEKREQGFSLYINGANRENTNLLTSRRTKTADESSSSRHLLSDELQFDRETNELRAKTAPTKLLRKEWRPVCVKIKTETGDKINVKVPGKFTGIYSEDFDGMDDKDSESEETVESSDEDRDAEVEQLSLSINDVHKLRRSLEMDASIRESIQTVIEGDSSVESDEDNDNIHDIPEASKSERHIVVEDLEASTDDEEIEEELEIGNVSLDMNDSKVLENIPHLRSSCDVSESLSGRKEKLEHVMSMLDQNKTEDTVVLSFCNNKSQKRQLPATRKTRSKEKGDISEKQTKSSQQFSDLKSSCLRGPRPLSGTCRKKMESSFVLSSQDVLNAVALENEKVEKFQESSRQCCGAPDSSPAAKVTPGSEDRPSSLPTNNAITEQTIAMVTKKVQDMDASQQKQLLELLGKLDPINSPTLPKITLPVAFASPVSSPPQPLSPQTTMSLNANFSAKENSLLEVYLEIKSNWGHGKDVGLTEIQFFDDNGLRIEIPKHYIHLSNGSNPSEVSLENLVNGKTKTTNERYMWKYPYDQDERIKLLFQVPCQWNNGVHNISRIKVWNYNKKMKDLAVGVKNMRIFIGSELVWDGVIEKGCGNQIYDYAEVIYLKSKKEEKTVEDIELPDSDCVIQTYISDKSQDEPMKLDNRVQQTPLEPPNVHLESTFFTNSSSVSLQVRDLHHQDETKEDEHFTEKGDLELPSKLQWLEEIKEKRVTCLSPQSQPHPQLTPKWLEDENGQMKDSETNDDLSLLDKRKTRSRPSSGRRSAQHSESSSKRNTPRPESGRRSAVDQHQEAIELEKQLTKLCVGELETEENLTEEERMLEESLNSLSQFRRCHQGRITPSNKIEMDQQGDALDDLLTPAVVQHRHSEQASDGETMSSTDDFVIPELPCGQRLVIKILSTWGDQYYVGLNGIEIFSDTGKPVQISKITADPPDINVLPEYKKDPRISANLIDGVYCTRDDMHLWLAPFTAGKSNFIYVNFKDMSTLAMLRIWNYNKSRIHSFRGAKDIEIYLDDNLIFRGEMARASGELGTSETFGDTILFTMNEVILEAMATNDETYEPDLDEDEDYLQTSNNFKRPVTADTGIETEPLERPFTCPKERKRPTMEPTYPNNILEDMTIDDVTDGDTGNGRYFGQVLELNFVETWGDLYYLGLTGLQVLGTDGEVIELTFDMLQACPKDLNDLPEYNEDDRTLDKLIDGENVTMCDEHMWLIPFTSGGNHFLTITLKEAREITGLRLWNYNKSQESTYRGAKTVLVKLDGNVITNKGILIRKGPGNCHFDFVQDISFLMSTKQSWKSEPAAGDDISVGFCELTLKPCGFVFQFQLFASWGDPYYLGLNGVQFFDQDGELVLLDKKNVTAYPESCNVLQGVKDDVRTADKLIDGVNETDDGRHMWLAPVFPGLTNLLYFVFDEPTTISMIKLWNYRKTPMRGVRQFSILVDDLLVFNGILPQVPTVTRGILPNMDMPTPHSTILFTDDEVIRKKEKSYAINAGGYFENQEVCLMNDKTDFPQKKRTVTTNEIDQSLRPKTSVTNLNRTRR